MAPTTLLLKASSLLVAFASLVWLTGCAAPADGHRSGRAGDADQPPGPLQAGPVTIHPGERVQVLAGGGDSGPVFVLRNASATSARQVYSDGQDQMVKVVDDRVLHGLIQALDQKGMFAAASAEPPPGARELIVVETRDRRWCWGRMMFGMREAELPFHEAKAYVLTAWNQATAYHSSDIDRSELQAEGLRAREDGDQARDRLRGLQGRTR